MRLTMRIVITLGGNALLRRSDPMTTEVQRRNIKVAAERAVEVLAAFLPERLFPPRKPEGACRRCDRLGLAHHPGLNEPDPAAEPCARVGIRSTRGPHLAPQDPRRLRR